MKELLKTLCSLDGVSGQEDAVRDWILAQLRDLPHVERLTVDPLGNILVNLKGKRPAQKTLLFAASTA